MKLSCEVEDVNDRRLKYAWRPEWSIAKTESRKDPGV